ncbi:MAG TPA: DUF5808 domain-containing protein [Candidatus Limnocylindria bacterium]|nr:DUF5808 domain-containing protein [Candidatus Limnocylindria bacterium]
MNTLRREMGALGWILRTVTFGLVAAAVYKELQLPADKRTWHGRLFDVVPYDFRIPTPCKLIDAFWNPNSKSIFSEQPFGVGWTINLGALVPTLRGLIGAGETATSGTRRRRPSRAKAA